MPEIPEAARRGEGRPAKGDAPVRAGPRAPGDRPGGDRLLDVPVGPPQRALRRVREESLRSAGNRRDILRAQGWEVLRERPEGPPGGRSGEDARRHEARPARRRRELEALPGARSSDRARTGENVPDGPRVRVAAARRRRPRRGGDRARPVDRGVAPPLADDPGRRALRRPRGHGHRPGRPREDPQGRRVAWIFFARGSSELAAAESDRIREASREIDELGAAAASAGAPIRIEVVGRGDSEGTSDINLTLSRKRAEKVLAALNVKPGGPAL